MEGLEETATLLNQAIDDVEASFSTEMNDIKRIYGYVVFPFNLGLFAHTFKRVVIDTFNTGGKAAAVEDQVLLWMSLFGILFKIVLLVCISCTTRWSNNGRLTAKQIGVLKWPIRLIAFYHYVIVITFFLLKMD